MKLNISSFFQDLFNFIKAGSILGIDIGTTSIKAAEVAKADRGLELVNYGLISTKKYLDHPNLALQNGSLNIDEKGAAFMLKTLLRDMKPRTKMAFAAAPLYTSFVTILDLPKIPDKELKQAIDFQASQYIPLPPNQVSVDWFKVDESPLPDGRQMMKVLLVGIPQKVISAYQKVFKSAGLKLVALELDVMALVRAFRPFSEPTLILDIGGESSIVCITENGQVKFTGQLDYGGSHLTKAVAKGLGLNSLRAEEFKRRQGISQTGGPMDISTLLTPFLNVIIQEVNYVIDSYNKKYSKNLANLVMIGGGSRLTGIGDYFAQRLQLKLLPPDVLFNVSYPTGIEPAVKSLQRELPIALGLAKKYFTM